MGKMLRTKSKSGEKEKYPKMGGNKAKKNQLESG